MMQGLSNGLILSNNLSSAVLRRARYPADNVDSLATLAVEPLIRIRHIQSGSK